MMFTVLTLRPKPGHVDEVVAYYRRHRILEVSGAQAAQLLVSRDDPREIVVTAVWPDAADYERWLADPERARFGSGLAHCFDSEDDARSRSYQVVHDTISA
ncbi:putative quinol monooxygenase [Streptomyces sp. SYSU K21746]